MIIDFQQVSIYKIEFTQQMYRANMRQRLQNIYILIYEIYKMEALKGHVDDYM